MKHEKEARPNFNIDDLESDSS